MAAQSSLSEPAESYWCDMRGDYKNVLYSLLVSVLQARNANRNNVFEIATEAETPFRNSGMMVRLPLMLRSISRNCFPILFH